MQADAASRRRRGRAIASWTTYALTSLAAGAAAAAGARAVDPGSSWYRGLAKPSWQPPPRAFGLVWTPLYVSIAWAGGHALRRTRGRQRNALAASLAVNAAWNWMFFGLRSPRAGLAGTLLLDLSNAELIGRMARTAPRAATALVPYALWCAFATPTSPAATEGTRSELADDTARGVEPELFELIGLAAGPGDKFIQPLGVEPHVGTRQGSQRTPARRLALDTQPQEFQFFQITHG